MNIDKYKVKNGYEDEDGAFYDTAEEFIQISIFNFCGCGYLEENLEYIRKGLELIDTRMKQVKEDTFDFKAWSEGCIKHFGNKWSCQFFFYWCDNEHITEHGTSIPGWLTQKGIQLLEDLNEIGGKKDE